MEAKIHVGKNLMPTPDQVIEIMTGPSPKGPKRCFNCHKPFCGGEIWPRYTSVSDPQHGAYSIGINENCREVRPQRVGQSRLNFIAKF